MNRAMTSERSRFPGIAPVALSGMLLGCTAHTKYEPRVVARGELTLRYDDGFEMWAGNRPVSTGPRYNGLREFVRCVPKAADHAARAATRGTHAATLSTLGIVFGIGSLAGIGGLYYYDKDKAVMAAWLGTGIAVAAGGVVLGALSRQAKGDAHGHAIDALNYYNDAVGSLGATCNDLRYPEPAGPLPPPPPPDPEPTNAPPPGNESDENTPPATGGSEPIPAPPPSATR